MGELIELKIVMILTAGFILASLLGYLAFRIKLSPIVGYLVAGYLIGPYSPGYEADVEIAEQLAEIGVILMMFGVGLHFKIQDLISVKNVAVPGAIGQTFISTLCGAWLVHLLGWPIEAGIIIGLSIGVASTVILIRMLSENNLLNTPDGHLAVGWLIVEDIITVIALLLVPILGASVSGEQLVLSSVLTSISIALLKFIVLALIMLTIGKKVATYILSKIMESGSHELFTLSVLALTFGIATGSSLVFGTSIALGAFIAGMIIGQTHVRHKVSTNALPLKDAFAVIFFLSIGMLFDVSAVAKNWILFAGILGIILIVKPLTAFLITCGLRYPIRTGLIMAASMAQIGEFSFILAEEASRFKILPDVGYDIIVASALISIVLNPFLFKLLDKPRTDAHVQ